MPPPTAAQILPSAMSQLQGKLDDELAGPIARAMANLFGDALTMFAAQTQILPGVLAAVDPITTNGQTIAQGLLMPPSACGPTPVQTEELARAKLQAEGLSDETLEGWTRVLCQTCDPGLLLLSTKVTMEKNVNVAGMVTSKTAKLE